MNHNYFYTYLHKQIPVMILLSLFPGLGYIFLGWMHDIELRAIIWYAVMVVVSIFGYGIYRQYLDDNLNSTQLKLWYKKTQFILLCLFCALAGDLFVVHFRRTISAALYCNIHRNRRLSCGVGFAGAG